MKALTVGLTLVIGIAHLSFAQQSNYDVVAGDGNGVRFWNGSDSYKIHMGTGAQYQYGPVTDYSIKMNMSSNEGRGWTWGPVNQNPVAALNTFGEMQIAGSFNAMGQIKVGGVGVITSGGNDVYANIRVLRNTSPQYPDGMYIGYAGSGGPLRFFSNSGTTEFMSLTTTGNLGLGITSPSSWFSGRVFEMSDTRPILKLTSTSSTGLGTVVFTNSLTNSTSHLGEFHINHQFNQTDNDKSLLRFHGYPSGDILVLVADGNIGMGTTAPQSKLDVNGGISLRGQLAIDSGPNEISIGDLASGDGMRDKLYFWTRDQKRMTLDENGNVGIGTTTPNQKLTVNGTIYGKEVLIDLNVPGPDYVFEKDYNLPSLEEIKTYIDQYKHLPEVPSAKEMEANGINVGEMNMILLKKVEELTLYMLELKKDNIALKNENERQNEKIQQLQNNK